MSCGADARLGAEAAPAIAALCARTMLHPPAVDEIQRCLFAPDQPTIVRGDPAVGIVAAVPGEGGGSVRLLVVDPAHQRRGHGRRLLETAEADLRVAAADTTITIGADPPYHLQPGVETTQLAMHCLLERCRYTRGEANFNMDVDLDALPPEPAGPRRATPADRPQLEAFLTTHWPWWTIEGLRAADRGTALIDTDADGITGVCAWDVNRRGEVGPVAVRPDLMGKGAGAPLLDAALHQIRRRGRRRVEVSWVGPIRPYARVGATIGRVFYVYRKTLRP